MLRTELGASLIHRVSTLLRWKKGEKQKIVQIGVFLIIFVTDIYLLVVGLVEDERERL